MTENPPNPTNPPENPAKPIEITEKPVKIEEFFKKKRKNDSDNRLIGSPTRLFLDHRTYRELTALAEKLSLPLSAFIRSVLENRFEEFSQNIKPVPHRIPIQVMYSKKLDSKIRIRAKDAGVTQSELIRIILDRFLYAESIGG